MLTIDERNPKELNNEELRQRIAFQKGQLDVINDYIKKIKEDLK